MKLVGYYRSSTSYRARIALNLKGIDYEQVSIDLKNGEQYSESFKVLNPYQTVPVIEHEGRQLFQSLAIIDWLELSSPTPSFVPDNADAAQRCKEFYYAIATELHAPNNLTVLNYLRRHFNADDPAILDWYATWINKTFMPIEARLAEFDWLSPELPFGIASLFEIVLVPQLYNARRWQTDISGFPNLLRIDAHCQTMPAFQRAHPDKQPDAQ